MGAIYAALKRRSSTVLRAAALKLLLFHGG
jgi:hypothetical protein